MVFFVLQLFVCAHLFEGMLTFLAYTYQSLILAKFIV